MIWKHILTEKVVSTLLSSSHTSHKTVIVSFKSCKTLYHCLLSEVYLSEPPFLSAGICIVLLRGQWRCTLSTLESILARLGTNLPGAANMLFGKESTGCLTCVTTDVLGAECTVLLLCLVWCTNSNMGSLNAVFYFTSLKTSTKKWIIGCLRNF